MSRVERVYSTPNHCLFYPEPPYQYVGARCLIGVWRAEQSVLERVLPAPLELTPEKQVISTVCDYPHVTGLGGYHASALFIRARFKDIEGAFCCHCYMDNDAAVAAGREIWGFPKKLARVQLSESGEIMRGVVERGNIRIMSFSMNLLKEAEAEELPPLGNLFNLKRIPSPEKGAPLEVHELTLIQYKNFTTHLIVGGEGTVEFEKSPSDPLYIFEPLEMMGAFYVKQDVELPLGKVIHRYP